MQAHHSDSTTATTLNLRSFLECVDGLKAVWMPRSAASSTSDMMYPISDIAVRRLLGNVKDGRVIALLHCVAWTPNAWDVVAFGVTNFNMVASACLEDAPASFMNIIFFALGNTAITRRPVLPSSSVFHCDAVLKHKCMQNVIEE